MAAADGVVVLRGTGPTTWAAPVTWSAGGGAAPSAVALGDPDCDGWLDAVVACGAAGTVAILRGNGATALGATPAFGTDQTAPTGLALGDMAGPGGSIADGRLDVAAVDPSGSRGATLLTGDGAGGLTQATGSPAGTNPGPAVAIADVSRPGGGRPDGRPDLVLSSGVGTTGAASVRILHGPTLGARITLQGTGMGAGGIAVADLIENGRPDLVQVTASGVTIYVANAAGSFSSRIALGMGSGGERVQLSDVDRDGDLDIVTSSRVGNRVSILLRGAGTSFSPNPAGPFPTAGDPVDLAVADVDRDGVLDLVVSARAGGAVQLRRGAGIGPAWTLGAPTTIASFAEPMGLAVADLTGDGRLDLVATDPGLGVRSLVHLLVGDGAGGFGARRALTTRQRPVAVEVGDLSRDGKPDVVTLDSGASTVSLLRGR